MSLATLLDIVLESLAQHLAQLGWGEAPISAVTRLMLACCCGADFVAKTRIYFLPGLVCQTPYAPYVSWQFSSPCP